MIIRKSSYDNITKALAITSKKYNNNLIFNRLEAKGKNFIVTLKVRNSKKEGARRSWSGRRLISACWHAHGDFIDNLIKLSPEVHIVSLGKHINIDGGNWIDWNAGSMMNPVEMSELCDCN